MNPLGYPLETTSSNVLKNNLPANTGAKRMKTANIDFLKHTLIPTKILLPRRCNVKTTALFSHFSGKSVGFPLEC
jgi:hypothetical protein